MTGCNCDTCWIIRNQISCETTTCKCQRKSKELQPCKARADGPRTNAPVPKVDSNQNPGAGQGTLLNSRCGPLAFVSENEIATVDVGISAAFFLFELAHGSSGYGQYADPTGTAESLSSLGFATMGASDGLGLEH